MVFLLFNIFLLIILLVLVYILSMLWPPDSPWAPWWKTKKEASREICKSLSIDKKDVVYDLGSGDGTFIIVAAKEFGARAVGIEIDPFRYFWSRFELKRNGLGSRVLVKRKNFFKEDLSDATIVFLYLVPKALEKLKPKLLKELKPGTRVATYKYDISLPLEKYDKKNNLRIYRIS